jgi:hypothetical protein
VWVLDNVINKQKQNMFALFCYFIMYTTWYNIVLFPNSGLGYIEWAIVFVVLTSNFFMELTTKNINTPFMGQRPVVLIYFGSILFAIKMMTFLLVDGSNAYDSFILKNDTCRMIVFFFSIMGLLMLLSQLYKYIINKMDTNFLSLIKKIIKYLLVIFSLPIGITICIIIIVSCVALPVFLPFWISGLITDLLHATESGFRLITSTGEVYIYSSQCYYWCQLISFLIVVFYTVYIEKKMAYTIEKNIEMQIVSEIDKLEINDKEQLLNETKKMLIDNRFNEQLKFLDKLDKNNTMIKDTIASINEKQN